MHCLRHFVKNCFFLGHKAASEESLGCLYNLSWKCLPNFLGHFATGFRTILLFNLTSGKAVFKFGDGNGTFHERIPP